MAGSKAYYDEGLKQWVFPKAEAKVKGESAYDATIARLPISRVRIHEIAVASGFVADAESVKGKAIQEATFATKFIDVAVAHELANQKKTSKK